MNELFDRCLANVNPDTRAEVRKNMEEISKRAESLYPDNPEYWAVYTAAARDQQMIDTDKACQFVCRLCEKCGQCSRTDCPTLVDVRKAMEG